MDTNTIIVYLGCILFLFLLGKFFILPLKCIAKLIGNSILGGILIFLVNMIGSIFEFHIGLNIGTAIVTGILGIPRSGSFGDFKATFIKKSISIYFFQQKEYNNS